MTERHDARHRSHSLRFEIAGLYYHIPYDEKECGRWEGMLLPEPTNEHDSHAIRICKADGTALGYVPKTKTWYIKKVMEMPYECEVRITTLYDNGDMMGLVGTCILRGEGVGNIDKRKFKDPDIDGYADEPVKCITIDADSDAYNNGHYSIFIGNSVDSIDIVGYEAAMRKVWRLEQLIREGTRHVASADISNAWTCPREVCLTVKQRMSRWRPDRVVLQKQTVEMLECDVYWIEKNIIGVEPLRYRLAKKNATSNNGDSIWADLSWADIRNMSLGNIFAFGSGLMTSYTVPSLLPDNTAAFDWETFEMQISSDEYFDFRW